MQDLFPRKNSAKAFSRAFIADISPQKIFSKAWMRVLGMLYAGYLLKKNSITRLCVLGMTGIPTTTTQTEPVGVSSDLISFLYFSTTRAHTAFRYSIIEYSLIE